MNFSQSFRLAIKSILSSKTRSILTMLGIIIGVAAVIIIVALGQGMANDMKETFQSMGTNLLTVSLRGRGSSRTITPDQIYEFTEENSDVFAGVTPLVTLSSATLKYEDNSTDTTTITGVGEDFCAIKNYAVTSGRFLQYIDISRRQKVCVIGTYVLNELFSGMDPLGETLRLNGEEYKVIGVLEEKASSEESTDDDQVIIPYTLATKMSWSAQVSSYAFSTVSSDSVADATELLDELLSEVYVSDDYYSIRSQEEMMETMTELTNSLMLVLVAIAAISLLVGGIGIMNIMLVSVTERTREIGIRKSLGAKKKDIMSQFVIEAATTSSVGGVIGIIVGVGLANVAAKLMDMSADPSVLAIATAFLVSLSIGIAFGFLPANKAAKLNPIDALRYD